jgi:hypothetical protein
MTERTVMRWIVTTLGAFFILTVCPNLWIGTLGVIAYIFNFRYFDDVLKGDF